MELADIFQAHWSEYAKAYRSPATHYKVAHSIMRCRTEKLGGHVLQCNSCGKEEISYNSCRNRHCPKCQGSKSAEWVAAREKDLLPVGYFHSVFTLPAGLNPLIQMAPREMYELLFQAVSKTLLQIGKNNLKCEIGAISILHTWGSALTLHPHLHCLIPGCGIKDDGSAVRFKKKRYFVSDKILSRVFRAKFLSLLKRAYRKGKLPFDFDDIDAFLNPLVSKQWVVKTQPPFNGPSTVLKYLARYTHRVAISNNRILKADAHSVSFSYKDYRSGGAQRAMKLHPHEFIRRFLQHCLPHQFVRIRHYGFLAHTKKVNALKILRQLLGSERPQSDSIAHRDSCPRCKVGTLMPILELQPFSSYRPFQSSA